MRLPQHPFHLLTALALACVLPLQAQVPDSLRFALPPPATALESGAQFGVSVATTDQRVVVGGPFDDGSATDDGVAKVYDHATGALVHVLRASDGLAMDYLGTAVAISGSLVAVGVYGFDVSSQPEAGRVLVYNLAGATPTVPIHDLRCPTTAGYPGANFGRAIALSGSRLVVGAPRLNTSGGAFVYNLSGATPTTPTHTIPYVDFVGSPSFGLAVAVDGTRVVIGAPANPVGAELAAGRVYVYDLSLANPTTPWLTYTDPTPAGAENYGAFVGLSGNNLVVGAPGTRVNVDGAGAAYAYNLVLNPNIPVQLLMPTSPTNARNFGYAVAVSGNLVLVGAPAENSSIQGGRVYQYNLSSGTPSTAVLSLYTPTPAAGDRFGHAVAISGIRVVIGAPQDDTGATDAGSAYLFLLSGTNQHIATATLNGPGPSLGDSFGKAVAVSESRVILGSPLDDTGTIDAGNAVVYDLLSLVPTAAALVLANPAPATNDQFGNAVALSGQRAVVGAWRDDTGTTNSGSAYVFDLASANPSAPERTLNNPAAASNDHFGYAVGIAGLRVVVGAPYDDVGATDSGTAYVYDLGSATPTVPTIVLNNPAPSLNELFGFAVAISGSRVVVGASADTGGGRAYVYDVTGATPAVPVVTIPNPSPTTGDNFGAAVAISDDRIIIGASGDDTGATNTGSAYVFDLASATPTVPVATLANPSPDASDAFGLAVALAGARAIVAAGGDDATATDAGAAYVYDLAGATPGTPVATLANPSPAANDQFGTAVAIDSAIVAIGAPLDDTTATDKGYAYILTPSGNDADADGLLDLWEYVRFGTTEGHGAFDDADGDGRVELLELAFDRNPLVPDAASSPQVVNEGSYLTITLTKRSGVNYLVESAATTSAPAFSSSTTTVLLNNPTTLKVRDNVQVGAVAGRMLRVKATAAP